MTTLEAIKLGRYKLMFGEMTSEAALNEAIENEIIKINVGPLDPAFTVFAKNQRLLEEYALLLEKERSQS